MPHPHLPTLLPPASWSHPSAAMSTQHKATQPLQGWSSSSLPHHFCNHAVSQIKQRSSNRNKSRLGSSITALNTLPLLCVRVKFLHLSTHKLFCSPFLGTGKFSNTNLSEIKLTKTGVYDGGLFFPPWVYRSRKPSTISAACSCCALSSLSVISPRASPALPLLQRALCWGWYTGSQPITGTGLALEEQSWPWKVFTPA